MLLGAGGRYPRALCGSLAGFVAALSETSGSHLLDPIGYGLSLQNLGADYVRIGPYLGAASVEEGFSQYSQDNSDNPFPLTEGEFFYTWSVFKDLGLEENSPL